ncbi:TolC family protein [Bythopirellula polymerisocia]|uniref:Outer membrane efflux protein n=1 Tax=Bythopirellula polymerisocia TaxID=2528003 RepID=A0A5C6CGN9_9BACT|nr:TolC family protein [Bythopirellula polymerisocia]TWU22724.1 Outer membrane efflux protein [Bythopirellula polymerisocia]
MNRATLTVMIASAALLVGCRIPSCLHSSPVIRGEQVRHTANDLNHDLPASALYARLGMEHSKAPEAEASTSLLESPRADESVQLASVDLPLSLSIPTGDPFVPSEAQELSLEGAIQLALERNPNLTTVRASEPVAHAAFHVAETYPWNPQFQTQVLPYSRDRNGNDGAVSQQHVIVQTFELGGQQHYRERAAAANWRQVSGTVRQAELTTAAQTITLFFGALFQHELRDMNQALAEMNEQLVGVMQRRQKAGQANNADVELARLQSQTTRRQQRLTEASYQTAYVNLLSQLNLSVSIEFALSNEWLQCRWRPIDEIILASPAITTATPLNQASEMKSDVGCMLTQPENETILRQIIGDRPDVSAARAGVAMARENLRLAKAMKRPNLQIGPMWQRDETATQYWGVQAQMDIPVVNTGSTLVSQRYAEWRQQQVTAQQLENRAVLEARAAITRYERSRVLVEQSREESVRTLSESLQPFEDQFKAGQINLLQVFAARTAIVQSRQSYLDLLNELALAVADVTQSTGLPPQLLMEEDKPNLGQAEELPLP